MHMEEFDWYKYYSLAESFKEENDSAKLRTGIGRFYYSSFLESRDHILKNGLFLNNYSQNIMESKSGRVHQETRLTFQKHPKLNLTKTGEKIAKRLNILRKYRNMVDYDSEKLRRAYNRCHSKSKRIFELLEELD